MSDKRAYLHAYMDGLTPCIDVVLPDGQSLPLAGVQDCTIYMSARRDEIPHVSLEVMCEKLDVVTRKPSMK